MSLLNASKDEPKHSHAFHVNMATLNQVSKEIPAQSYFEFLANQLSLMPQVHRITADWIKHFFDLNWCNPAHMQILSFHNEKGDVIKNTVTVENY